MTHFAYKLLSRQSSFITLDISRVLSHPSATHKHSENWFVSTIRLLRGPKRRPSDAERTFEAPQRQTTRRAVSISKCFGFEARPMSADMGVWETKKTDLASAFCADSFWEIRRLGWGFNCKKTKLSPSILDPICGSGLISSVSNETIAISTDRRKGRRRARFMLWCGLWQVRFDYKFGQFFFAQFVKISFTKVLFSTTPVATSSTPMAAMVEVAKKVAVLAALQTGNDPSLLWATTVRMWITRLTTATETAPTELEAPDSDVKDRSSILTDRK